MTKIKNTKKGMAKKTLSMSLVVAMLATSNVPVWAAEFSDGTDPAVATETPAVETFADETAETPVVEDNTAVAATEDTTISNSDIDVSGVKMPKSVIWGQSVNVTGNLVCEKNPAAVNSFHWGWRIAGTSENVISDTTAATSVSAANIANVAPDYAGKTLELHIWRNDATYNYDYDVVVGQVAVEAQSIEEATFTLIDKSNTAIGDKLGYNGKEFSLDGKNIKFGVLSLYGTYAVSPVDFEKYFKVTTEQKAKNAGDTLIVAVSARDDVKNNPYVGTTTRKINIVTRDYVKDDMVATYEKDVKYTYTGNPIQPEISKITVAESNASEDPALVTGNGKLSGADLSYAIEDATTDNTGGANNYLVGKKNITITLDKSKLTNFTESKVPDLHITGAFEIVQLDLADCKVTVPTVTGGTEVQDITPIFHKGDTLLNLRNNVDYELVITDDKGKTYKGTDTLPTTGTFIADVYAKGNNTKGSVKSVSFKTSVITISSVSAEKAVSKEYTGKEIKPVSTDFGKLTVSYKTTVNNGTSTSPASEVLQSGEWEITGYSADVTNAGNKHYATIKVNKEGSPLKDQTFNLYYTITPLTITSADVTLQEKVVLDKSFTKASEYELPVTVIAKSNDRKTTIATLTSSDYTVNYKFMNGKKAGSNTPGHKIYATVTITNPNFVGTLGKKKDVVTSEKGTELVSGLLNDSNIVMNKTSYVYTGGKITPDFKVMVGTLELEKGTDYVVKAVDEGVDVGTATLKIEGRGKYQGCEAKAKFEITPANIEDVKIVVSGAEYKGGKQVRPDFGTSNGVNGNLTVTLNDNPVSSQFEVTAYGTNVNAGKGVGSVTISKLRNNKNFNGTSTTGTFDIKKAALTGTITVYDKYGKVISNLNNVFKYDGTAKEFASVKFAPTGTYADLVTADDYEIRYVNNIYGDTAGNGSIIVVTKDSSNFAGADTVKDYVNDTKVTGVAAKTDFTIGSLTFDKTNVTVRNGVYAGGLPVKPEVIVQFGGKTLEEGKDYKLVYDSHTEVTSGKKYTVSVVGLNGYKTSGTINASDLDKWGIDKQTIANCDVTVKDGVATVINGTIKVPVSEYTVTKNSDDTYTVAAKSTSKNYTGSKTVQAEGKAENEKPDAPMITSVKVVGNKATAILSGDSEGAAGYDYVISTDRDCITNKDYDSVNKNQVQTSTTFKYVQQGTYYAYCHAWKRDENGKKVFSDWSNAYPFVVSAITPDAPVITNVTVSGSTIKVTYKAAANATGYDVVLGTDSKKENGETRPYHYGNHKKLNLKEGTVTATFKNVPKGTWVVGMHAFNRTSEDGKKVFSPWSNLKKATVK
ncbi:MULTISPECIES: hypothetical protein [Blautia]|jgi:hypothetical protein|nr:MULTISPECIES: hypothetical protein [Blautia]MDB6460945.1 hypothetical protein [Blautia wexlerae]MDB6464406.1 hypothetical protein [Blautia wexlerae]